MLFNSFDFLLFFPVVVLIFWIVPKRARSIWLLAASYYFYMSWNPKYAILMVISTLQAMYLPCAEKKRERVSFATGMRKVMKLQERFV